MARPSQGDYGAFYETYVSKVQEDDIYEAFRKHTAEVLDFFEKVPAQKLDYAYATGKWTIKQVLQHLIDAERIFAYRALRFARKDYTPLSPFEENDYAAEARVDEREWMDMVEEFQLVRLSSEHLFRSLNEEELQRSGIASGVPVSVLSLGYILIGHAIHHMGIVSERYL
ncbi:DinB family protein [Chitinophaga sp. GCM10012297]|uniref:DinB family protein n=1 Tax=Chitinophaga chungangae TaxID=2821488 RepID=A0ABS3Y8Y0_9BACT|nr:DinB family protein [Chitinophaga chungangae]MBO9151137.1 DinB family protein [Chitinophaga chungangae]